MELDGAAVPALLEAQGAASAAMHGQPVIAQLVGEPRAGQPGDWVVGGEQRVITTAILVDNPAAPASAQPVHGIVVGASPAAAQAPASEGAKGPKKRKYGIKFKGVYACKGSGSNGWQAQIRVGGTMNHLGVFRSPEEAARAYDEQARLLGRHLNFPNETGPPPGFVPRSRPLKTSRDRKPSVGISSLGPTGAGPPGIPVITGEVQPYLHSVQAACADDGAKTNLPTIAAASVGVDPRGQVEGHMNVLAASGQAQDAAQMHVAAMAPLGQVPAVPQVIVPPVIHEALGAPATPQPSEPAPPATTHIPPHHATAPVSDGLLPVAEGAPPPASDLLRGAGPSAVGEMPTM